MTSEAVLLNGGEDLYRGRLMVPLRYLAAIPHYIWWGIFRLFILFAIPLNWLISLILGRQPMIFYEFLSGYIRYRTQLLAYLTLLADPYPGFAAVRPYPVEADVPPSQPTGRLSIALRPITILPAYIIVQLLQWGLVFFTLFAFVVCLVLGRMPPRVQLLGLSVVQFMNETSGYGFIITSRYPGFGTR